MDGLLRRTLNGDIVIRLIAGDDVGNALVDPSQLEAAVLNLCINARDAMPKGGQLTIETQNVALDEEYVEGHAEVAAGPYVVIAISDTGTGIAPDVLPRVFEPFFTTKDVGKGTGLGLSMVYGFARQSGGHARIYSELGHGTTVKLYLPRIDSDRASTTDGMPKENANGHGETILVVEDEELVRYHVQSQLEALGYQVVAVADAKEALHEIGWRRIDLLFTDVVMPGGMNGKQLAAALRQLNPTLPVLYTSGYAENAIVHQGQLELGVLLLSKPYSRAELARKVRAALASAGATADASNAIE
jgi:CheY-like chemotaxis protein